MPILHMTWPFWDGPVGADPRDVDGSFGSHPQHQEMLLLSRGPTKQVLAGDVGYTWPGLLAVLFFVNVLDTVLQLLAASLYMVDLFKVGRIPMFPASDAEDQSETWVNH